MADPITFDGAFIKFNGRQLQCNATAVNAEDALRELRVFKKMINAEKRKVNEAMRQIRSEFATLATEKGPASQGFLALLFRGTRFGGLARTVGSIDRQADRRRKEDALAPHEEYKRAIEKVLTGIDQIDVALNKALIEAA